jgi:REP-associated tyrosine transposase
MARLARFKVTWDNTWYHVFNHAASGTIDFPLEDRDAQSKLMSLFVLYARIYGCKLGSIAVMGNHYHAVLLMKTWMLLSPKELRRRAEILNPGQAGKERLDTWSEDDWDRFNRRLFDLSDFMKDVQQNFSSWYNRRHNRRGHFWGARYKSTVLEHPIDACLYVELNPVRAGLVKRPEDYKGSTCFLRAAGQDFDFAPLTEITGITDPQEAEQTYRSQLYWRGAVPTKENQQVISEDILRKEEAGGFARRGCFRQKMACYTDGLAVGTREHVANLLEKARDLGLYKRRSKPLQAANNQHYMKAINNKIR